MFSEALKRTGRRGRKDIVNCKRRFAPKDSNIYEEQVCIAMYQYTYTNKEII